MFILIPPSLTPNPTVLLFPIHCHPHHTHTSTSDFYSKETLTSALRAWNIQSTWTLFNQPRVWFRPLLLDASLCNPFLDPISWLWALPWRRRQDTSTSSPLQELVYWGICKLSFCHLAIHAWKREQGNKICPTQESKMTSKEWENKNCKPKATNSSGGKYPDD